MKNKYFLIGLLSIVISTIATPQTNYPFLNHHPHENHLRADDLYPEMDSLYQTLNRLFPIREKNGLLKTKSTSDEAIIKLDSIVGYQFLPEEDSTIFIKTLYGYDTYGNKNSEIHYNWLFGAWVGDRKYEFEYNANGNLTIDARYDWDLGKKIWIGISKKEFEYNAYGNNTLEIYNTWDLENEVWVGYYKIEYEFDTNGNMTLEAFYNRDSENQAWIANRKDEYAYNANGKKTFEKRSTWDQVNEVWIAQWKYENEFDTYGLISLSTRYDWDRENDAWVNYRKSEYYYHRQKIKYQLPGKTILL
jgi:hypothetical protein